MGTLTLRIYPADITLRLADHTYVETICSDGNKKGWGCWGGKTNGKFVLSGAGSSIRANMIAGDDEKAGITCYLYNGVCHQAANRVLLPANRLIDRKKVRGYSLSEGLFGPYGRVRSKYFCYAPFERHAGVTGDLEKCEPVPPEVSDESMDAQVQSTEPDEREAAYIEGVLKMYADAASIFTTEAAEDADQKSQAETFHTSLFLYMAEHNLGSPLDKTLSNNLIQAREPIEKARAEREESYANEEMRAEEFVSAFNDMTRTFQDAMANVMNPEQYTTLFNLEPGVHIKLADPDIVKEAFGIDDYGKAA